MWDLLRHLTILFLWLGFSSGSSIAPRIPAQNDTNKYSLLGTLQAPTFGDFLTGNQPWGDAKSTNLDHIPFTGKTRFYDFTVARGKISPDGVEKNVILVNGQFPGPTIEANWGDTIQVTVHNRIANPPEGTAMHWHGLRMQKTPWYDGAPSISQCPIAPGQSFTYRFQADSYGTSWYHGHYSAQTVDGLLGPMIIHGPKHAKYDVDLGPIMLGDYHHKDYLSIVKEVVSVTNDFKKYVPTSDNNLINGKNDYNCSQITDGTKCTPNAPLAHFKFHSGKTYRLRLINSGAAALQRFSIDGHKLQVIANDFTPIVPYETDVVSLGVGQRSDVLVKAIGKPTDSFWMRATLAANCSRSTTLYGKGVVLYESAPQDAKPNSTAYHLPEINCANDDIAKTTPLFPITPEPNPAVTQVINLDFKPNATGNNVFLFNNQTFRANYNSPLLLTANQPNPKFTPENNVYNFGGKRTIRVVLNNLYVAVHPMHIHGHNMYILSEGDGPWDGKTLTNAKNPQRRDTQMLRRYGHIVFQIEADNPGVWPFHCHIAWHQSMGMSLNILERPDDIQHRTIPRVMKETCRAWDRWTKTHVVEQIDAGI
ncbi:MAG: hypothetical protein LQ342_007609 [Letrouitia transgressa]|nr:MAG: hypothetical protein LQ342_007609 [Letrouitia transgressa]